MSCNPPVVYTDLVKAFVILLNEFICSLCYLVEKTVYQVALAAEFQMNYGKVA